MTFTVIIPLKNWYLSVVLSRRIRLYLYFYPNSVRLCYSYLCPDNIFDTKILFNGYDFFRLSVPYTARRRTQFRFIFGKIMTLTVRALSLWIPMFYTMLQCTGRYSLLSSRRFCYVFRKIKFLRNGAADTRGSHSSKQKCIIVKAKKFLIEHLSSRIAHDPFCENR